MAETEAESICRSFESDDPQGTKAERTTELPRGFLPLSG